MKKGCDECKLWLPAFNTLVDDKVISAVVATRHHPAQANSDTAAPHPHTTLIQLDRGRVRDRLNTVITAIVALSGCCTASSLLTCSLERILDEDHLTCPALGQIQTGNPSHTETLAGCVGHWRGE